MPAKLGIIEKTIPFLKAYLGNVLKYQKDNGIVFDSLITPTLWSEVNTLKYIGNNDYGEWIITSDKYYKTSYKAFRVFNNNAEDMWCTNTTDECYVELECPNGLTIKPKEITIIYGMATPITVYGYNPKTEAYEKLWNASKTNTTVNETISITNNVYYSKFKITLSGYDGGMVWGRLYEFQIKSGIIRQEV